MSGYPGSRLDRQTVATSHSGEENNRMDIHKGRDGLNFGWEIRSSLRRFVLSGSKIHL